MNLVSYIACIFVGVVLWLGIRALYRQFIRKSTKKKTSRIVFTVDMFYIFFMIFICGWILYKISYFYLTDYAFVAKQLQQIERQLLEYQKEYNCFPEEIIDFCLNSQLDKQNMLYVNPMLPEAETLPYLTLYYSKIIYTKNIGQRVKIVFE